MAVTVRTAASPTTGLRDDPANGWVSGFNNQTGTTYTIAASDDGLVVTLNNASPVAVTLPQAGTLGFEIGRKFGVYNRGAGLVTITPTTSTINGGATKTCAQG